MTVEHAVGSVWHNEDDDFILLVLTTPDAEHLMSTLILDNGVWPSPAGRRYQIHVTSLHCYYKRIA